MFRIIPHNMVTEFEGHPEQIQRMIDGLKAKRTGADGPKRAEIDANISMLKTKLEDAKKIKWGKDGKIVKENMNDASPEERRADKAKWSDDDRRWKVEAHTHNQLNGTNEETSQTIKLKNHIEHLKDLIRQAPQEDKIKLREIMKSKQAELKKASGGKIDESAIDDEDVHLQSAHDALSSRITKCKREGKDCKALEARLSNIAALLKKA